MSILRVLCIGISFLFYANSYSQQYNINDYKYIIVPEGYSFLTENDKYQLNSLTRFLLKKHGFNAFNIAEGFPEDLKKNGCKALRVDLKKNSDFFYTKLSLQFTDCNGKVVYTSSEGKSKEKEFKKTYQEALRNAFKDVVLTSYVYNGKSDNDSIVDLPVVSNSVLEVQANEAKEMVVGGGTEFYVFNNEKYTFRKQSYGFELLKDVVSVGKIVKATRDNTYIIQADELSGYGYFDIEMNFVIEKVNPTTNELIANKFVINN